MGSRARALAENRDSEPTRELPPSAASFWDEDSGSVQAPMQRPVDSWQPDASPAREVPSPAAAPDRRPRHAGRRVVHVPRRRVLALLAAAGVAVLAIIGLIEGSPSGSRGRTAADIRSTTTSSVIRGEKTHPSKPLIPRVLQSRTHPRRHATRPSHRTRRARIRSRAAAGPARPRSAEQTTTTTSAQPSPVVPTTTGPATTTPSGSTASGSHTTQPAYGPTGGLGPGSSPDG